MKVLRSQPDLRLAITAIAGLAVAATTAVWAACNGLLPRY